jgi:hypothetical protein
MGQDHGVLASIRLDGDSRIVSAAQSGAASCGAVRCGGGLVSSQHGLHDDEGPSALITTTLCSYIWWDFWLFVQNFGSYVGFADQRCECAPHTQHRRLSRASQTATVPYSYCGVTTS